MKIRSKCDVDALLAAVKSCDGNVYLTSVYGDKYNLKSELSQYIGIAALLGEHGEELEIWCSLKEDEPKIFKLFRNNPEML